MNAISNKFVALVLIGCFFCGTGCSKSTSESNTSTTASNTPMIQEEYIGLEGITLDFESTYETAQELNEQSDLGGHQLLEESNSKDSFDWGNWDGYTETDEDGTNKMSVSYCPYPYDTEKRYLTQIEIYSTRLHVFGIRVGDDVYEAQKTLEVWGYILQERKEWGAGAILNNIDFDLYTENGDSTISKILISVSDPTHPSIEGAY